MCVCKNTPTVELDMYKSEMTQLDLCVYIYRSPKQQRGIMMNSINQKKNGDCDI